MSDDEQIPCTDIIGSEAHAAVMTTERKHDGYAVFMPDGSPYFPSIRETKWAAIGCYRGEKAWPDAVRAGHTVRPVTITEVKDDE